MKASELFDEQKTIHGNVNVPRHTTELNYEDVTVYGKFSCYGTAITSLKGSPKWVAGDFNCSNTAITSLEGAPTYVGGSFLSHRSKITSIHNVHKQIKHIGEFLYVSKTIKSNILGVMLIKGLRRFSFYWRHQARAAKDQIAVEEIINKHLKGDRDVHACQEEMIEAGLAEYARL